MIKILVGDVRDKLKELADDSVHCVVTSPPYWGLRDYGTGLWEGGSAECDHGGGMSNSTHVGPDAGDFRTGLAYVGQKKAGRECQCGARRIDQQLGLEPTWQEHVATMADVFDEVRRVLRKDGMLWLNYGDSYAASVNGRAAADIVDDDRTFRDKPFSTIQGVLKPKDLCGIPWRVAFALQERGWWLRQDIIWAKPNPMPESVTDRCTKAHEYVFLLAKSPRYFFDAEAISETVSNSPAADWYRSNVVNRVKPPGAASINGANSQSGLQGGKTTNALTRNRRSVWTIATAPFAEAHFATFPPELAELCIKAGTSQKGCCAACGAPWVREVEINHQHHSSYNGRYSKGFDDSPGGSARGFKDVSYKDTRTLGWSPSCQCNAATIPCTVLDPFGGAGTTGLVADRLQRHAILIELSPEYAALAQKRLDGDRGGLLDMMEYDPQEDGKRSWALAISEIRKRKVAAGELLPLEGETNAETTETTSGI